MEGQCSCVVLIRFPPARCDLAEGSRRLGIKSPEEPSSQDMRSGIRQSDSFERGVQRLLGLGIVGIVVDVVDTYVGAVVVGVELVALVPRLDIVIVGRCFVPFYDGGGRI